MYFKKSSLYLAICALLLCGHTIYTLDIIVTSEADSGAGTLRDAITDLNINGSTTGPNNITFALNVNTILLTSPLSTIQRPVTINGFGPAIECDKLSPVDNPQEFSAAITVTINGSKIPTTGSTSLVGLFICANDVVIRGLRIEHFSNIKDAQVAGIATNGSNTLIECCEVTKINGNIASGIATVSGIYEVDTGDQPSLIVSKCFVHKLHTRNRSDIETITQTGSVIGIGLFKTVRDCRIADITSGNIIHTNSITSGSTTTQLYTGSVTGISSLSNSSNPCSFRKQCQSIPDYQGSEYLLIDSCIIDCCQTGSITATKSANAFIGLASGITVDENTAITQAIIADCSICNIYTGNALLSGETFIFSSIGPFGIETFVEVAHIANNSISEIHRGTVKIGGINSSASLFSTVGIIGSGETIVAKNNYISNVTNNKVVASGICTTIKDESFVGIQTPPCIGLLAAPFTASAPICAGTLFEAQTVQLCANTVTNINAGKRISNGEQSLVISGYTAGIWVNSDLEITAEANTVQNIVGAELIAKPASRGVFGGIGSKGIALWSTRDASPSSITATKNTIKKVYEHTLHAAPGIPGEYIFLENISNTLNKALHPVAQTTGLSIKTNTISSPPSRKIIVTNNIIQDIAGATVNSGTPGIGTIATGITVEPPAKEVGLRQLRAEQEECSLFHANGEGESEIHNNDISNIWAGTKNAAYGILLDATNSTLQLIDSFTQPKPLLFSIQNNIISNIFGLDTPQPFNSPIILTGSSCGITNQDLIHFIPFPYQPTSGIYSLFGNCCTIANNTITTITEPNNNARGVATQASHDVDITTNTISKIQGYGIFIGGATADIDFIIDDFSGMFTTEQFESFFASTRNKIFSNSTFDNTKNGIKLGLINWNDYFEASFFQCQDGSSSGSFEFNLSFKSYQKTPEYSVSIIGNHGQPEPHICTLTINRNGTITAQFIFEYQDQPLTTFIIQFFASNTNSVPHGEQHISDFYDPACIFKTDINGNAKKSITFTPVAHANSNDIFSAHVTVATTGQNTATPRKNKGDTSEFGVEIDAKACPPVMIARPSIHNNQKPKWLSFLGR